MHFQNLMLVLPRYDFDSEPQKSSVTNLTSVCLSHETLEKPYASYEYVVLSRYKVAVFKGKNDKLGFFHVLYNFEFSGEGIKYG